MKAVNAAIFIRFTGSILSGLPAPLPIIVLRLRLSENFASFRPAKCGVLLLSVLGLL